MKNPYPKARGYKLQRDCWQEGYDAKEKEDQDLYEALKAAGFYIAHQEAGRHPFEITQIEKQIKQAIAKWEGK